MRELVLRMERSERLMVSELAATRRELSRGMTALGAGMAEIAATMNEMRQEQRASREALFRILDRLDRLGPGDAPA